jgi:uracil-DNA glycosylase
MTRYELYVAEWKDCTRCHYSKRRTRVVLGKADSLPCDVAFIGEGPGVSEDRHGIPFYGQAGFLMEQIHSQSVPPHVTTAYTNIVGCIPLKEGTREKEDPDDECVEACTPRLQEFISLAAPRLIVCIGKQSSDWILDQSLKYAIEMPEGVPIVSITHPSAINRQPWVNREPAFQQCVITIRTAIKKYVLGG